MVEGAPVLREASKIKFCHVGLWELMGPTRGAPLLTCTPPPPPFFIKKSIFIMKSIFVNQEKVLVMNLMMLLWGVREDGDAASAGMSCRSFRV